MNKYKEIIDIVSSKDKSHIELGLDRVLAVLDLIGNPQNDLKCIQIAGTNGKGSVASILSAILTEAGYKTGLYTSPHIFEYTERIKISGIEISKNDFADYVETIINIADKNDIHLTEFEILTVTMFKYFQDNNVDIVILETGLGGRLDATNVVLKNLCAIITHIDLEHVERLGNTKDKIAYEKAGIIKSGCPIITTEGYEVIKDTADSLDSMFVMVTPFVKPKFLNALSLKGTYQQENLALAISAIQLLYKDINDDIIIRALAKVNHLCRFQYIKSKNLLIDAAHNPNGIKVLNDSLDLYFPNIPKRFIFGCLKNKDYKKMLNELFSFDRYEDNPPKIYFYHFNSENACSYEELKNECIYFSRELNSIADYEFSNEYLTIICGSIYMINELVNKDDII
ncbi:MAG: bifunctional folylpolyglutamate synthase/dihydrofolate synthase [Candidatus Gastranaerophilaceae bacterium]